jgi:hypothetical protein
MTNPNAAFAPPATKTKTDAPKAVTPPGEKVAKVKAEKAPVDPNAPKKERAPKNDYGYSKNSIIHIVAGKDTKFKGQRLEWWDRVKPFDGKTCDDFSKAHDKIPNGKGKFYAPSGWLRFYAREGFLTLERPAAPAKAEKTEAAPAK